MENGYKPEYVSEREEFQYIQTPVSIGEWMITLLIMTLPLINVIMLFIWAFSGNSNISKANWAKATIIWGVIIIAVYLFFILLLGGLFTGLSQMSC